MAQSPSVLQIALLAPQFRESNTPRKEPALSARNETSLAKERERLSLHAHLLHWSIMVMYSTHTASSCSQLKTLATARVPRWAGGRGGGGVAHASRPPNHAAQLPRGLSEGPCWKPAHRALALGSELPAPGGGRRDVRVRGEGAACGHEAARCGAGESWDAGTSSTRSPQRIRQLRDHTPRAGLVISSELSSVVVACRFLRRADCAAVSDFACGTVFCF